MEAMELLRLNFDWAVANWDQIYVAVTSAIGTASAVAALTPTPKDDAFVAKVHRTVNFMAMNVKNARNANQADPRYSKPVRVEPTVN